MSKATYAVGYDKGQYHVYKYVDDSKESIYASFSYEDHSKAVELCSQMNSLNTMDEIHAYLKRYGYTYEGVINDLIKHGFTEDAQMFKHCLDIPEFIKQIDLHLLAAWCK